MESKKRVQINLFTKQKQSHRCRKQTWLPGGKGGGINWEIGIDIYILLYIKQITDKDLLYSTGNSTQYSNGLYGKESKKREDTLCIMLDLVNRHGSLE